MRHHPTELVETFTSEIEEFGRVNKLSAEETVDKMARQYDGYHFHPKGDGVFNPFSVLNAFSKRELGDYWFQTGTPTFLVEMSESQNMTFVSLLDGIEARLLCSLSTV